jgi:WD40 repeat protein/tRNA A-37 threonylcarbamoyl transferase component Bud32
MSSARICPVCAADLPGDAPRGLCPRCLLAQVFQVQSPKSKVQSQQSEVKGQTPGQSAIRNPQSALGRVRYFGDYELLGEIAEGGMGVVYYARQVSLNRLVALKMIRSGHLATAAEVQRFQTEAEAAANLDHPNIVPIYEIGQHEGQHYFSMKLMEGGTLAEWSAEAGTRSAEWIRRATELIATIARAVHHAHQRGVLHRDIKPTNVLLDDLGQPHLTDFGLAKILQDRSDFAQSLAVVGTPGYMAPEQAAGRARLLTTAADIYGLGAILYELLTGRPPFQGDSTLEILSQVKEKEPERPRKLNPRLDRDLETICLRCLEKEPERRYGTAEMLAEDLEHWRAGEPILARPVNAWERTLKWTRRNPAIASLTGSAIVIFLAGLAGVLFEWRQANLHAVRAIQNAARADANARESQQRLVRSYVADGNRLLDDGDPFAALLWFAEALRLDAGDPAQEAGHRLRLASTLRQSPRLLQVCIHGSPLSGATFNRDGTRMLTTGRDGTVLVWDVESGQRLLGPLRHPHLVPRASFVEHDQSILTATYNGDGARLWDASTGKETKFFAHKGMRWTTLSDDAKWLLTWGGLDSDIKLWDAHTGALLPPVLRHGYVTRIAVFSPDGSRFATASTESTVILWDRATMKPLFPPLKQDGEVRSLAFNATGTRLFAGNWGKSIQVWDTATGREAMPPLPHKGLSTYAALSLSPDGKLLASLSLEGTVRLWDSDSGRLALSELRHSSAANQMAFAPAGGLLAVGCLDGTAYLWDLAGPEPACVQLKQSRKVYGVSFSPDSRRLLTASSDGTVRVWDVTSSGLSLSPWAEPPAAVLEVGDDAHLLTQNADHSIQLWDTQTWKPASPALPLHDRIAKAWLRSSRRKEAPFKNSEVDQSLLASAATSGDRLLTLCVNRSSDCELRFQSWDLASARALSSLTLRAAPDYSVWVSPDTRLVALAQSNLVSLSEVATGKLLWQRPITGGEVRYVAFDPAGTNAAVLGRTEGHLLSTATGQALLKPIKFSGLAMCAAFSPDGQAFATACGDEFLVDREARVWDTRTGRALTPPLEHQGAILSLAFSPDGRALATASHDRTTRLWDARTGEALTPPLRHNTGVSLAAFSPDSRSVATFSEGGFARLWDVASGEPLTPRLKHPAGLSSGCFVAGGKYLFTQYGAELAALWELPADNRPVQDWMTLASMLAARRLNAAGFLEPTDSGALTNSWQTLRAKYPEDFRPARGFVALKTSSGTTQPPNPIRPVPVLSPTARR